MGATCTQVILVYGTVGGESMSDEYCGFMSQDLKKDVLSTFDRQGFLDHWYHSKGGLSSILRLPSVATQGGKWLCLGNAEGPSVVNVYPTMVPPIHVTLDDPTVAGECPAAGGQDVTLNLSNDSTTLFDLPFELTHISGITSLGDPTVEGFHQYRLVKINERPAMLYFLLKALPDPNGSSDILSGYLHYATAESEVIACVGGGVYKDGGLSGDTIVTLNKVSKAGHCPLVPLEVTPPP